MAENTTVQEIISGFTAARDHRKPILDRMLRYYQNIRCYASTPTWWTDADNWRSNVFLGITVGMGQTIIPRIAEPWLDLRKPPVRLRRRPKNVWTGAQRKEAASAHDCITYQLQVSDAPSVMMDSTTDCVYYGMGLFAPRWERRRGTRWVRRPKVVETELGPTPVPGAYEYVQEKDVVLYDDPVIDYQDPFSAYVTPRAVWIKQSPRLYRRTLISWEEFQRRVQDKIYEPVENAKDLGGRSFQDEDDWYKQRLDAIKMWGSDSQTDRSPDGKTPQWLEILEEWSDDTVRTVLDRKVLVRSRKNILGFKPFIEMKFIQRPGEWDGIGLCELLDDQEIDSNKLYNARNDLITRKTYANPIFNPNQFYDYSALDDMRPMDPILIKGGIHPDQAIRYNEGPKIDPSMYREDEVRREIMQFKTGITDYLRGADSPSMNDTAAGVATITNQAVNRVSFHLKAIMITSGVELFRQMLAMNRLFAPPDKLFKVTGSDEWATMNPEDWGDEYDVIPVLDPQGMEERAEAFEFIDKLDRAKALGLPLNLAPDGLGQEVVERLSLGDPGKVLLQPPTMPEGGGGMPVPGMGGQPGMEEQPDMAAMAAMMGGAQ